MDRKFLEAQGVEAEKIDAIMAEHGKTVNPLKQEKESLQSEVDNLKTDISERDTQLEDLQGKVGSEEDLKATIESLKTANKEKDDERKRLLDSQKLDYELRIALNSSGARNERAVKALLDLDTVKINEDGQLTGLKEQLDNLQESDSYLFTQSDEGNDNPSDKKNDYVPGSTQGGNGGKEPKPGEVGSSMADQIYGTKEEK